MYFEDFQAKSVHTEVSDDRIPKENLTEPECNSFDANLEVIIVCIIS